ncbi:MAG: hypothetical protein JNL63_08740 [Bacteroidia bacterium]|nr:hypothetical protein [Bacteroidia bacterium]
MQVDKNIFPGAFWCRRIDFATLCLFLTSLLYAQEEQVKHYPKNTIYVEALGSSLFYSVNYEARLINKNNFGLSARIGLTVFPNVTLVPVGISILKGKRINFFEAGAAIVPDSDQYINYSAAIGWRRNGPKGLFTRCGFSVFYSINMGGVLYWPALGIGFGF